MTLRWYFFPQRKTLMLLAFPHPPIFRTFLKPYYKIKHYLSILYFSSSLILSSVSLHTNHEDVSVCNVTLPKLLNAKNLTFLADDYNLTFYWANILFKICSQVNAMLLADRLPAILTFFNYWWGVLLINFCIVSRTMWRSISPWRKYHFSGIRKVKWKRTFRMHRIKDFSWNRRVI